jgi:DNA-directed RNA polymerase beta subunit
MLVPSLTKMVNFVAERVSARNVLNFQSKLTQRSYLHGCCSQADSWFTASLVPFIEKNRIDRSLTGSNMQKQAVPLLTPESPTVGTGIEAEIARNTANLSLLKVLVKLFVLMVMKFKLSTKTALRFISYSLRKEQMTTAQSTKKFAFHVATRSKGRHTIEGASIAEGEIALGKDLLVAFMPWGGYNMDDAVVLSRRSLSKTIL